MGKRHAMNPNPLDDQASGGILHAPSTCCAAHWGHSCWPLGPPDGPRHGPLSPQTLAHQLRRLCQLSRYRGKAGHVECSDVDQLDLVY